jgi:hypothetical protein
LSQIFTMCALHYNLYPLKVYRINLKFYTIHCKKIKPKGNTNQVLACNELYQKSPEEKWSLKKGILMTDYYIGTAKVMIGTGLVSATGLAVVLLNEEDLGPTIGDPPKWPGE